MKAIISRFVSLFLSGGIASAIGLFATGQTFNSVDEAKKFGLTLLIAFVLGGIGAIEKALNTPNTSIPVTIVPSNVSVGVELPSNTSQNPPSA